MFTPNEPQFVQSGISGKFPAHWFGVNAIDGTAGRWLAAGTGSTYTRVDATTKAALGTFTKRKEDGATDDWVEGLAVITQTVSYTDFTDSGGVAGTLNLTKTIPAGAFVVRCVAVNVTGFTGDTTAVLQVGDGTDIDRYMSSAPSVFTTAVGIDLGSVSGTAIHVLEKTVRLTLTSASDFTLVTAGQATIRLYYYA